MTLKSRDVDFSMSFLSTRIYICKGVEQAKSRVMKSCVEFYIQYICIRAFIRPNNQPIFNTVDPI